MEETALPDEEELRSELERLMLGRKLSSLDANIFGKLKDFGLFLNHEPVYLDNEFIQTIQLLLILSTDETQCC